jgi:mRNA interferase RelE/StbE
MMYRIEWKENAIKDIEKLERNISRRIYLKIEEISIDPFSKDIKKLKGIDAFRLRVGDYRIILDIKGDLITVLKVGHRKNIYNR